MSDITYTAHTAAEALELFGKVSFLYLTVPGRKATTKSRRLRNIYLHSEVSLPIPGTNSFYRTTVNVTLTVDAARKMLQDMAKYPPFEGQGARLVIGHSDYCIFLGGAHGIPGAPE